MVKRRSAENIMSDMLRVALIGAKKTRMVYRANLNFKIIKGYLDQALDKNLIEYIPDTKIYLTTEQGKKFIAAFDTLEAFFQEEVEVFG